MATNTSNTGPAVESGASGFQAQVTGANVVDLIQMNCLARMSQVFEIRSGLDVGYLHFDGGQLLHAEHGALTGHKALVNLIALASGTFKPTTRTAPASPSFQGTWQSSVLRAVQELDEGQRAPQERQVPRPAVNATNPLLTQAPPLQSSLLKSAPAKPTIARVTTEPVVSPASEADPSIVRLTSEGGLVASKGKRAEATADATAYAGRLAQRIGDELGLGAFKLLDAWGNTDAFVVHKEASGHWLGAAGPLPSLTALRTKLGGRA